MSREKELAKNTVILTFGKICTQFVSFLLLPLYTALLLPEEYGMVDLFNTYIILLVPIFNWQFESGLFRFMLDCRDNKDRQKEIFTTVIVSNIYQSLIYITFYYLAHNFIASEYKIFLAIDVIINIFLNTLLQFPRGLGHNTSYAIASFLSASTTVALNVIFITVFRMGAYGMFLATVIAKVITIIYLVMSQKVWRYFILRKASMKTFKEISKYSFPLIPNQLSWWVVGVSDRTIVTWTISVAANGVYSIANKFSSMFITFYNIFNMSWTESVSLHIEDEDRNEFLAETINSMFKLFSAICFGIIACMPFVFPILINEQYSTAYQQIPILMIAVLFQVVVGLYSVIYVALKKSVEIAKTSFYAAIINIVVDIILIKFIGMYAASISTLLAYATMAVYRYFHVKKYVNVGLGHGLLCSTVIIGLLTLGSYYYNRMIINVLVLIIVIIYAIVINKNFLRSTVKLIINKVMYIARDRKEII